MPRKSRWVEAEQSGLRLPKKALQTYRARIEEEERQRGKPVRSTQNARARLGRLEMQAGKVNNKPGCFIFGLLGIFAH